MDYFTNQDAFVEAASKHAALNAALERFVTNGYSVAAITQAVDDIFANDVDCSKDFFLDLTKEYMDA
jgi:hypothetical protein